MQLIFILTYPPAGQKLIPPNDSRLQPLTPSTVARHHRWTILPPHLPPNSSPSHTQHATDQPAQPAHHPNRFTNPLPSPILRAYPQLYPHIHNIRLSACTVDNFRQSRLRIRIKGLIFVRVN